MSPRILLIGALAFLTQASSAWAQGDARGSALISEMLAAYSKTSAFSTHMDVLSREGNQSSRMGVKMIFAHPQNIALTILDAKQFPAANGTTLTWLGASKVRVSTSFYGIPLGITLPVNDQRLTNLRGYSLPDVTLSNQIKMLQESGTNLRYLGATKMGAHSVEGIEVRSNKLLRGIDRESIWMDSKLKFPVLIEMFEAGRVVYRMAFSNYEFNPQLPAALFARF